MLALSVLLCALGFLWLAWLTLAEPLGLNRLFRRRRRRRGRKDLL